MPLKVQKPCNGIIATGLTRFGDVELVLWPIKSRMSWVPGSLVYKLPLVIYHQVITTSKALSLLGQGLWEPACVVGFACV